MQLLRILRLQASNCIAYFKKHSGLEPEWAQSIVLEDIHSQGFALVVS